MRPIESHSILELCASAILAHVDQEFPTWNSHRLSGPKDLTTPRQRHPLFYGSYDWHSCVHSHWALVRVSRVLDGDSLERRVHKMFERTLSHGDIAAEVVAWKEPHGFQLPYGASWFLRLMAELKLAGPDWRFWHDELVELESLVSVRMLEWLGNLKTADRNGQHFNSAASMVRLLEWAEASSQRDVSRLVRAKALELYSADSDAPFKYEPSAASFISPLLAEADLMGRCLEPDLFSTWLETFAPSWFTSEQEFPATAAPSVLSDYHDAHLAALPFTISTALRSLASSLADTELPGRLDEVAASILSDGLARLDTSEYSVDHWLNSYVIEALT